ncbi:MAG: putative porin [Cytophagales bacterium]|nr:putative porin [Bernardetiaceae bacterium]MDW8211147.1 putative porin [Cytophagales bacterium]
MKCLIVGKIVASLSLFIVSTAQGQDPTSSRASSKKDSIQYGPHTTRYYHWHTLYYNRTDTLYMDTVYTDRHRYNLVQRHGNTWQDLGVFGTAAQPIFFREPEQIGTRLGHYSFSAYRLQRDEVRYYDSYSPVTDIDHIQGGKGRTRLRVTHARSITPDLSAALFFQRQEANSILGRVSRRNDPMLTGENYGAMVRYFLPNLRYKLLAHFIYSAHTVQENGGYSTDQLVPPTSQALARINPQQLAYTLQNALNREKVRTFHLYQEYRLDSLGRKQVQVFHQLEWLQQGNEYIDENPRANLETFYRKLAIDLSRFRGQQLSYVTDYEQIDNRAGIKGQWNQWQYWTYLRSRVYGFRAAYTDVSTLGDSLRRLSIAPEWFAGLTSFVPLFKHHQIQTDAEVQLPLKDYRLKIIYHNKWFKSTLSRTAFSPDLTQKHVFGSFFYWNNTQFERTLADRLTIETAFFPIPSLKKYLSLSYFAGIDKIQSMVYYDTAGIARQSTQLVQLLHAGCNLKAQWQYWHWHTQLRYSQNIGADVFRVPLLLINSQLFLQKKFFNDELDGQIGLDFHWKSAFYANAYMPATSQFILNDRYLTDGFPVLDAFFNFKISRALLFVKVTNLLQDIAGKAYFNTPRYYAQPRSLEIGVRWLFFD